MDPATRKVYEELDVTIRDAADEISFQEELAAEGVSTVSMDEDGELIGHRPDGSEVVLR